MNKKPQRTDREWRELLDEDTYHITREKGTERPFTGAYLHHDEDGSYHCVCCDTKLFDSETKYDSGSGWPSFYKAADIKAINVENDQSGGMVRSEILCSRCDAHLGHVFPDGPPPTGVRFCVNSLSLKFHKDGE